MEINVRNVHEALPTGLALLHQFGIERDSRNGPVLQAPWPVTTIYERPCERVLFWPQRDANPFFHLYESLWMLMGREDVAPLVRYAKNMASFSDDGVTLWAPYGHRWIHKFGFNQLPVIAQRLRLDPTDRRSVLQMWSAEFDLGHVGKDVPCNMTATFQRAPDDSLDMVVFNRSNDIIWGAYGANAVHFSMLLEYMALAIGCASGKYYQISVNYHAYRSTFDPLYEKLKQPKFYSTLAEHNVNPYRHSEAISVPMSGDGDAERVDELIEALVDDADEGFGCGDGPNSETEPWASTVYHVLKAHSTFKSFGPGPALDILLEAPIQNADWIVAARQWLERRIK